MFVNKTQTALSTKKHRCALTFLVRCKNISFLAKEKEIYFFLLQKALMYNKADLETKSIFVIRKSSIVNYVRKKNILYAVGWRRYGTGY